MYKTMEEVKKAFLRGDIDYVEALDLLEQLLTEDE